MAISSSDVSQLIARDAAAIQQQQAASQYPVNPYAAQGVGPGLDPIGSQIPSMAAQAATYVGGVPSAAMAGIGVGAMLGVVPRFMDPFTQAFHTGGIAARAGGGLMSAGGLAAGLGAGAAVLGAYSAVGSAADYLALDPFKTGAQMRGMTLGVLHSSMPNMPMSSMRATAEMMENLQRTSRGQYGLNDQAGLLGAGIAGGDLNTADAGSFQRDFRNLISKTKEVAQALSTSLTEAYSAMKQIQQLGVSDVSSTAFAMRGIGTAAGIAPNEMFGVVSGGAALAKQAGIGRDLGVNGAMATAGMFGYLGAKGVFGQDFGLSDAGAFQNAGYRFFGSQQGSRVLAAMMNSRGELDANVANQIAMGTISKEEINRLASITMNNRSDLFSSRNTELVATYMSEFGPAGIANPLQEMTRGLARPESARQSLTGLNREQLGQLSTMSTMGGSLKQQLANAAKEGFETGTMRMGLKDQLSAAVDKMTAPVREQFERMGSELSQAIAETIDDVSRDFMSRPSVGRSMGGYNAINQFLATGNVSRARAVESSLRGLPEVSSLGGPSGGFMARTFVPRGLRAAAGGERADLMYMNGLTPENYQAATGIHAGITGAATLGEATGLAASAEVYGYMGGQALVDFAGGGKALLGMGGRGMVGAWAGAAGYGVRAANWAARGASKVLGGPVGWGLMAIDAGITLHHAASVQFGSADTERADYTSAAQQLLAAEAAGMLPDGVGSLDTPWQYYANRNNDYIPIAGKHKGGVDTKVFRRGAKEALFARDIQNRSKYLMSAYMARSGMSAEDKLALDEIVNRGGTSDTKISDLEKLGLSKETAYAVQVTLDPSSPLNSDINGAEDRVDRYLSEHTKTSFFTKDDAQEDANKAWWDFTSYEYTDWRSAKWAKAHKSDIMGHVQSMLTEGVGGGDLRSADFTLALKDRLAKGLKPAERAEMEAAVAELRKGGTWNDILSAGAAPLKKGYEESMAARAAAGQTQGETSRKFIHLAATAGGVDATAMNAALQVSLDPNATLTSIDAAMTSAAGAYYSSSKAEQVSALARQLSLSDDPFSQQMAATLQPRAGLMRLNEKYLTNKGHTSQDSVKWLAGITGGESFAKGLGLESYMSGKTNYVSAAAQQEIDARLSKLALASTGKSALSVEELNAVQLTRQQLLEAGKNRDTAKAGALMNLIGHAPASTAKPAQSDAAMSKLVADFNSRLIDVNEGLARLGSKLEQVTRN